MPETDSQNTPPSQKCFFPLFAESDDAEKHLFCQDSEKNALRATCVERMQHTQSLIFRLMA